MKALTYNDLIQAQKEISAHNQQLREQSEQLEKDNSELRSQSLRLVCAGPATAGSARVGWSIAHSLAQRWPFITLLVCGWVVDATCCDCRRGDPLHCPESLALTPFG